MDLPTTSSNAVPNNGKLSALKHLAPQLIGLSSQLT